MKKSISQPLKRRLTGQYLLWLSLLFFSLLLFASSCGEIAKHKQQKAIKQVNALADEVLQDGLLYRMQYEPHAIKQWKAEATNAANTQAVSNKTTDANRFADHHYLTLQVSGVNGQGLAPSTPTASSQVLHANQAPDNWAVLSHYMSDDFRQNFSVLVNGERKSCVLHHAFFPPQRTDVVMVQLVFKDAGYHGQPNYFSEDLTVQYFDQKNGATLNWQLTAGALNELPTLNNKYNG